MSLAADMPWRSMRLVFTRLLRRKADLEIVGRDRIPRRGPVIVAARHVHHAFDGAALLQAIDRPTSLVVTLDWLPPGRRRELLAALCRAARWPAVIRSERFAPPSGNRDPEAVRRLRAAIEESVAVLGDGRVLVVFPEGYPNVDPNGSPKTGLDEMLPFREGYLHIAARLGRKTGQAATIVPAGFAYQAPQGDRARESDRWRIRLAFGDPVTFGSDDEAASVNHAIEAEVRLLSGLPA